MCGLVYVFVCESCGYDRMCVAKGQLHLARLCLSLPLTVWFDKESKRDLRHAYPCVCGSTFHSPGLPGWPFRGQF